MDRAVTTAAVVVLLAALVSLGVRMPSTSDLAVDGEVPGPRASRGAAGADPSVPPGAAPAPVPAPSPTPTMVETPTTAARALADRGDTPAVGDDTLVVPDGGEGTAPIAPSDGAAAPPAPPPSTPVGAGEGDSPRARFESRFPAHAAASQDPRDPATTRWAVLVGINEHSGTTRDNVGSRQDAESLYAHLMDLGWRADHVLLLTDELATRETMLESVHWLARRTTADSVAAFSYSGHAKQWFDRDVDGDGEVPDEALWPSDNQHITDREFADVMGTVGAGRLWLNIMACEAAGFLDPGLVRDGRVVTFSSAEDEKSYEDPSVGHSVWGWNLVVEGLRNGRADADGDGAVTVQEAASFAIPRAAKRTSGQSYGAQNGGMVDRAGGALSLSIPPPPPPEDPSPEPSPDPSPSDSEPDGDDGDGCLLGLCGSGSGRD